MTNFFNPVECFFVHVIDCGTKEPQEEHDFDIKTDFGNFEGYGKGHMKYRRCLKCGLIEYSFFTGENGNTVDIDLEYRNITPTTSH